MADFFSSLINSIFTPGPTKSLITATNITFCSLQCVLFLLLLATHSWHFVALSSLCGSLWWAINWFIRELELVRASQDNPLKNLQNSWNTPNSFATGSNLSPNKHKNRKIFTTSKYKLLLSTSDDAETSSDSGPDKISNPPVLSKGKSDFQSLEKSSLPGVENVNDKSGPQISFKSLWNWNISPFFSKPSLPSQTSSSNDRRDGQTDSEWEKVETSDIST